MTIKKKLCLLRYLYVDLQGGTILLKIHIRSRSPGIHRTPGVRQERPLGRSPPAGRPPLGLPRRAGTTLLCPLPPPILLLGAFLIGRGFFLECLFVIICFAYYYLFAQFVRSESRTAREKCGCYQNKTADVTS